jgi:hypothetical protein
MTTPTPPDWILLEAAELSGWDVWPIAKLRYFYDDGGTYRALCDMIQKHKKPPVDRKRLCAQEAMKSWVGGGAGPETICIRAIELWEEGFGK